MDVGMSGGVLNALPQVCMRCYGRAGWFICVQCHVVCIASALVFLYDNTALLNVVVTQVLEIHEVHGETMVKVVTAAAPCSLNRHQGAKNAF